MSTPEKTGHKLLAKVIYTHFSAGEKYSDTQWAEPVDATTYKIHSAPGETDIIKLGEKWRGVCSLAKSEDGRVSLGEWGLHIGRDLKLEYRAKPTGPADKPTGYVIRKNGKGGVKIKVGEDHPVFGVVGPDEFGNLATNVGTVVLEKKHFELSLLVLSERIDGGLLAYFNRLEPGHHSNRKDGAKGVFYPAKSANQPAKFWEYVGDKQKVNTAVIWSPKGGSDYCTVETFSPAVARQITETNLQLVGLQVYAEKAAITDLRSFQYYDEISQENLKAKQQGARYPFRVMMGANTLFPASRSNGYGR